MAVSNMIKNIASGVNEIGKIKIGKKGPVRKSSKGKEFQLPTKTDYFIITKMDEGADGNFTPDVDLGQALNEFRDADGKLRRIPVTLLYDDIELNFRCQYTKYVGKKLVWRGDGEVAEERQKDGTWKEVPFPQDDENRDYKINGKLMVMIRGANRLGGAWAFRTTSYNTVKGLISSLQLIKQIAGGVLQGIPLWLKLTPKKASDPDGNQVTIYVVNLEFDGNQDLLMSSGLNVLETRVRHGINMRNVELEASKLLNAKPTAFVDDDDNLTSEGEEFHPDQQEGYEDQRSTAGKRIDPPKKDRPALKSKVKDVEDVEDVEILTNYEKQVVEEIQEETKPIETEEQTEEQTEEPKTDWGDF